LSPPVVEYECFELRFYTNLSGSLAEKRIRDAGSVQQAKISAI
jgi:hypothetical protein